MFGVGQDRSLVAAPLKLRLEPRSSHAVEAMASLLGPSLVLNLPRAGLSQCHPPCVLGGQAGAPGLWARLRAVFAGSFSLAAGLGPSLHVLFGCEHPGHPQGAAWASLMPVPGFWPDYLGLGSCPTEGPVSSGLSPAALSSCRLNSTEYGELCEKLRAPIRSAANVVIRQSLGDLFLETFASLVEVNPAYSVPSSQVGLGSVFSLLGPHGQVPVGDGGEPHWGVRPPPVTLLHHLQELEACIGCMQTRASVKLVKTCQEAAEGECQQCYCRPMWCLTCMGKWFASRQDPQRPDTWLASRVPCPTCRARFCILDVCAVR